jgi:hypothetical protein
MDSRISYPIGVLETTAPTLRSPCNNITIVPHLFLSVQAATMLKKFTRLAMKPCARLGLPCVLSLGPVVVGGFLLKRNTLYSFAPWAQFRQPEMQELRLGRRP